jgi:hypothetical protein
MAHRLVVTLTVTGLLAVVAAGCGTSTSTSTSGARTAVSSPAPAPATTSSASPAPSVPPGFSRYQGNGFSFFAPSGYKPAPNGGLSGLPKGATAETLTPGGRSLLKARTEILVATNPRLRTDVDLNEVALSLVTSDKSDPSAKDVQTSISTMTVPGAQDVRTVTDSYIGPNGPHASTLYHRTWLMVLAKPGLLMDLVVVNEPRRGGNLNPATVLDSFRLDS